MLFRSKADTEMLQARAPLDYMVNRLLTRLQHQKACHREGYCSRCDLWYPSEKQLHKHFYDSYSHSHCVECAVGFAAEEEFGEVCTTQVELVRLWC